MRAVIYARYSSDKQTEQSIEGQLSVCYEYAKREGIRIVGEYIDRAISGRTDNRPDFQRMLADAAKKQWDYVIVYKGDRFARDRISSAVAKKTLRDNGVRLLSATENIPDTPEGIILESLLEGMAEYYSAELSQKVKRGIEESRKKGQMTGGRRPLGYAVKDKRYVVSDNEAEIVRIIFEEYCRGTSGKRILKKLTDDGLTRDDGRPVNIHTIYDVAHAAFYVGDDLHPPIITEEQWERAKAVHEAQKKHRVRVRTSPRYLLSGKVFCGECGAKYTACEGNGRGGNYLYYKCSAKMRKRAKCESTTIRKELLEDIVFEACCEVLEGDFLKIIVDKAFDVVDRKQDNSTLDSLKEALKEAEEGIENIMSAIVRGIITDDMKERLEAYDSDARALREKIRIEQRKKTASKDELLRFLNHLVSEKSDNDEFRESVFRLLVRSVTIFNDKIRITFNYAPPSNEGRDVTFDDLSECGLTLGTQGSPSVTSVKQSTVFFTPFFFGMWVSR